MTHHPSHDPHLVALSVALAILGSYTALDLFRRVRANAGRARAAWLAAAAAAMGLSIWSMHFVAMLAFDAGVPVTYDLGRTALSLAVAVAVTGAAFAAVARPRPDPAHVLAAGLFMGLGIAGMHYLGMAAMRLPAQVAYDGPLVALSLLVAVGASTAALALALRQPTTGWQAAGAVAAGSAISGMHYVAMLAVSLAPLAAGSAPAPGIVAPALAFNVAAATFFILVLALVAAGYDRRLAALAAAKAEALRRARDELDLRVRERTQELAGANARLEAEVAERRRAEAAARESGARLRALIDCLPFDLWACDRQGRYVLQNEAARRNWGDRVGLRPEETGGPPELVARWVEHNARALAGETVRGEESHVVGGELRHVEKVLAPIGCDGELLGCVGANIDVTERRRAHEALRESEQRYRVLIETSPDAVLVHRDGVIVLANRRAAALFGAPGPESLVGREVFGLVDGASLALARERTAALAEPGARVGLAELTYRRLDGTPFPVEAAAAAVLVDGRRVVQVVFRDIAARKAAEAELRGALERLSGHMENTPLGVVELALGPGGRGPGRVRAWSGQAEAIFGWGAEEAVGRTLEELGLFHEGDADKVALLRRDLTVAGRRHATATLRCCTKDRQTRHCCFHASSVRAAGGGPPVTVLLLVEDVTERLATLENVQRLAHHDTLTGLPNRLLFQDRLDQALRLAGRQRQKVALMLLDLDHFKDVNDSLGHPAGDQLLRELAERLSGAIRATDTWARLGGDEFALVQTGVRGTEDAKVMVRRVLRALERPFAVEGQRVHVSASLGATLFPDDGDTPERLMRNADMALYRAKAAGRRSGAFYRPEMDQELQASRSLQAGLRRALEEGGLALAYQPVFDVRGRRLVGVEALLRWRHPGGGEVPPATFIPVAESSGLIQPLGAWVLREACRQAKAWRAAGLTVAVNVSAAQLRDPELLGVLRRAIDAAGVEPEALEVEVTESVFLDPSKDLIAGALHEIAELGVGLAIDDFGAGYSSLGYLKHFPFHKVKIDGSFVRDVGRDAGSGAIVAAVVALGHALGKRVTAEWVEEEAQLAFLAAQGCDLAQGHLLGPPQAAEGIDRLVARGAAACGPPRHGDRPVPARARRARTS